MLTILAVSIFLIFMNCFGLLKITYILDSISNPDLTDNVFFLGNITANKSYIYVNQRKPLHWLDPLSEGIRSDLICKLVITHNLQIWYEIKIHMILYIIAFANLTPSWTNYSVVTPPDNHFIYYKSPLQIARRQVLHANLTSFTPKFPATLMDF